MAEVAWFAISDGPVSFGRFARLFRDSLGCTNALFLDGACRACGTRREGDRTMWRNWVQ